jgi:hypothetical protein
MWNPTVSNVHTFAIGVHQFVVHNIDGECVQLARDAASSLQGKRAIGDHAVAQVETNVLNSNGDTIAAINNPGDRVTRVGTQNILTRIPWGGACAEARCTAQIANALGPNGNGMIEGGGNIIKIGLSHVSSIGPCSDCLQFLQALATERNTLVRVGWFNNAGRYFERDFLP